MTKKTSAITLARGVPGGRAEQEALEYIARALPDDGRTRLWPNIVASWTSGRREIDALVLGHHGLFVVEIKAAHARLGIERLDMAAQHSTAAARHLKSALTLRIPTLSQLWIQPLVFIPDDDFKLKTRVEVPVVTPQHLVSVLQYGDLGDEGLAAQQEPLDDATVEAVVEALTDLGKYRPARGDLRDQAQRLFLETVADLHEQASRNTDEIDGTVDSGSYAALEENAALWVLLCTFVHELERRSLLKSTSLHKAASSARECLARMLDMLTEYHALAGIVDLWRTVAMEHIPSEEAAQGLLECFWSKDGTPRPLSGDKHHDIWTVLYQDLSESLRRRYGFVATPKFVAEFMLDLTLEQPPTGRDANETHVLDPACGSGTILCLAFERLLRARAECSPETDKQTLALAALERVHGIDISAVAVLVTQVRLLFTYIGQLGVRDLQEVPRLPVRVVVGDSLDMESIGGEELRRRYAVVLCNPPYLTCKEPGLRNLYRKHFVSAHGQFSLAAPFVERCFSLAEPGGAVGLLAPANFKKRAYGQKLIEEVLAGIEITRVIDTSGAYIPGHGTPTLILVARNRKPEVESSSVLMVLGKRGEPHTPINPARGRVWSAIRAHHDEPDYQDRYISVEERPRELLRHHPWRFIAGEPWELLEAFERSVLLEHIVESFVAGGSSGMDGAFVWPSNAAKRVRLEEQIIQPLMTGSAIEDWVVDTNLVAISPHTEHGEPLDLEVSSRWARLLWLYRTALEQRPASSMQVQRAWWTWNRPPRRMVGYALVGRCITRWNQFATHPGYLPKSDVISIVLPDNSTEDDMFALLGYLNSSVACFWLKNHGFSKSSSLSTQSEDAVYEFSATLLGRLPIPGPVTNPGHRVRGKLAKLARTLSETAAQRLACAPDQVLARWTGDSRRSLVRSLADARQRELRLLQRMVNDQEELDWLAYEALGLVGEMANSGEGMARPEERPFAWPTDEPPVGLEQGEYWAKRRKQIRQSPALELIEHPQYKRPFQSYTDEARGRQLDAACDLWLVTRLEQEFSAMDIPRCITLTGLLARLEKDPRLGAVASVQGQERSLQKLLARLLQIHAVPFLASYRYSKSGAVKRAVWEQTWAVQRRQDAGEALAPPTPPRYSSRDYRDASTWRWRGILDVAREPFISYPLQGGQATRYGWAGWSQEQRAHALVTLIQELSEDGFGESAALDLLLAGVTELRPWLDSTLPNLELERQLRSVRFCGTSRDKTSDQSESEE